MSRLVSLSLALAALALAACDADPVRPPAAGLEGERAAAAAAVACPVEGALAVRRIDPPGATTSSAVAVNDLAEAVAAAEPGGAFLWSPASGFQVVPIDSPAAINDLRQVVGTNGAGDASIPVVWSPDGGLQPLALPAGYSSGGANDINDAGVVVGWVRDPDYGRRPVRWVGGAPEFLSLEGVTYFVLLQGAVAVNDAGDVLGNVSAESFGYSLVWPSDGSAPLYIATPGLGNGGFSYDINDAQQLVSTTLPVMYIEFDSFLYTPGTGFIPIGPSDPEPGVRGFYNTAAALNNAAVVVGDQYSYEFATLGPPRAYRWTSSEGSTLLPLLPGTDRSNATDVNEAGLIVGSSGTLAVLWAPGTPATELAALADHVRALATSGAIGEAAAAPLLAKLTNAARLLAAGRDAPARNLVDAFANQVRALERSDRIDDDAAESLLGAASCLSASL